MSFNKWFPDRPAGPRPPGLSAEKRAWALRVAWYAATLMLVAGYVILFAVWPR